MEAEAEAESIKVSRRSLQQNRISAYFRFKLFKLEIMLGILCLQAFLWVSQMWAAFCGKVRPSSCLLQIKGEAEAFAVEAKGRAEAEQMTKKAEAFQQYKDGAMVDMLLEQLPLVRNSMYSP